MAKKELTIRRFLGLNTNADPRAIQPYNTKDQSAEAVWIENFDINTDGALITAKGFEKVSEGTGTGGIKNLLNYDKDLDSKYLIISQGGKHYSITSANTAWSETNLGSYGTETDLVGGAVFKGSSSIRRAILGNNDNTNSVYKIDIDNPMSAIVETAIKGGHIMTEFLGHLFIAVGANLYYCGTEDETTWGSTSSGDSGLIGFNDLITGLKVQDKLLIVFTRETNEGVTFTFDDAYNLVIPSKQYKRSFGCLAPKSLITSGAYNYYWSANGILQLGSEQNYQEQGIPRPQSMSEKIDPTLKNINVNKRSLATATLWEEEQQYWLAIPSKNSPVNDTILIYNQTWGTWTTRSGMFVGDIEMFRNENYENELYFGDANSPVLYKMNDSYSYDGAGYTRKWISKKFNFGAAFLYKKFSIIKFAGAMDAGTFFDVTIQVDNMKKKYRIDNTFLITDSFSDYIGDNWVGDALLGGTAPEDTRFKRFYAPLNINSDIREGIEMQITIENNGEEQPFKIDYIGIEYEYIPQKQVPGRKYINTQLTT